MHPEIQKLEDYSITTDAETSLFFLHMTAIMKKKILMQVRDMKTLVVDTIFPVTLIIFGMYLATVQVIKNGQSREMSVSGIYPAPINFIYNENSPNKGLGSGDFGSFIQDNVVDQDTDSFKNGGVIDET